MFWGNSNKLEHGFYRKLVDQKTGYLLSKFPSISTDSDIYKKELDKMFDRSFWRLIKTVGREALNKGIAWLQVYFKEDATLTFKLIPSEQIIPLWLDNAHTEINELLRVYDVLTYNGRTKEIERHVEHWDISGVKYYVFTNGELVEDISVSDTKGNEVNYHFTINGEPYNWGQLPFIPFRANDLEQPLIDIMKSFIDNYNKQASVNSDLLEDIPKFIYKLTGQENERVNLYLKKFDAKYIDKLIENLERQRAAYHAHNLAYRNSGDTKNSRFEIIEAKRKFNEKYYNDLISDFEDAKHWFCRKREDYRYPHFQPTLLPNDIAIALLETLLPRYNYILDRMKETGSGWELLEQQLGWFGKTYNPENDISLRGNPKDEFDEYVEGLCGKTISPDEQPVFRREFRQKYIQAYGKRPKDGTDKSRDNYGKKIINDIFVELGKNLMIETTNGNWEITIIT